MLRGLCPAWPERPSLEGRAHAYSRSRLLPIRKRYERDRGPEEREDLQPVKVVVTGPFGAGKTTFIRAVSEITGVSTEREITDETGFAGKSETTVAIDFGRITIDADVVLYLFGTPGQERFDFMWEVASRGMLGFILLVDCERHEALRESLAIFDWFRRASDVPFVVAANKTADFAADRERICATFGLGPDAVVHVNALERESVKDVLVAFLERKLSLLATLST